MNNIDEQLNQLLKGSLMGKEVFTNLLTKIKDEHVKQEFERIIEIISEHIKVLSKQISAEHDEDISNLGLAGMMSEFFDKVKTVAISSDLMVIEHGLTSIEMGQKALKTFCDTHYELAKPVDKLIRILSNDYNAIYYTLHRFFIQYQ